MACRDCQHRELLPLSDAAIYGHLAGDHTIGLYPLLENDHCHLLAVDFDEQDWRDDARGFLRSCRELAVPAALEISRSGEGAHVWVFFEEAVSAREARLLGSGELSEPGLAGLGCRTAEGLGLLSKTCCWRRDGEVREANLRTAENPTTPEGACPILDAARGMAEGCGGCALAWWRIAQMPPLQLKGLSPQSCRPRLW